MTLEKIKAKQIPSMGGSELGPFLYWTVMGLREARYDNDIPGAVVECGAWLGAGTAYLAAALRDIDSTQMLHCYDCWQATESECQKAAHQGAVALAPGEDLLPYFLTNVGDVYPRIMPHKGDTIEAKWPGGPIAMYVDDCNKRQAEFDHAMEVFAPHFIPRKTIIVLMDYWYFLKRGMLAADRLALRYQHAFVSCNPESFQVMRDFRPALSAVAFQFLEAW